MAGCTASSVLLYDNWPAGPLVDPPPDGFDGAYSTDVTTPRYQLGAKCVQWDETAACWFTMIYLKNTGAGSTAVGTICGPDLTALYHVDSDPDSTVDFCIAHGFCAVAVAVLATNDYGWFWCGGFPPQDSKYGCSTLAATSLATGGGVDDGDAGLMLSDAGDTLQFDTWTGDLRPVGCTMKTDE